MITEGYRAFVVQGFDGVWVWMIYSSPYFESPSEAHAKVEFLREYPSGLFKENVKGGAAFVKAERDRLVTQYPELFV